jgi:hypothetical protein
VVAKASVRPSGAARLASPSASRCPAPSRATEIAGRPSASRSWSAISREQKSIDDAAPT